MTLPADRPSPKADVRAIWEWLHRANERVDHDELVDADFAALTANAAPEREPEPKPEKPEPYIITRREQRAILRGFYRLSRNQPDAWADVRCCLEAEAVTRDFRRLVARMIEGNILHKRGQVPTALDRTDTKRRRDLYANLLENYYADLCKLKLLRTKPLAQRLVAFDLCLDYHDFTEPQQIANWAAFQADLSEFEKKVASICHDKRGTNKARKGIGAEVLAAATAARIIPEY